MTERDASATRVPAAGFADFSPLELHDLSEGIADNINTINSGLKALEETMKQIGGPKESVQLRDKIHDTQQNVNSSVLAVARDIQRLGAVVRRGDKYYELKVERHTQAFKDALANYETVQRQVFEKLAAHMPRSEQVLKDPQALEQQAIADDAEATLLTNQQAQARVVDFAINMFQEKEAYMNKIKADVLDVHQIIQELPTMVNEQSQTVESVEIHIEAASANVEAGVDEHAKAAEYRRRRRRIIRGTILSTLLFIWIAYLIVRFLFLNSVHADCQRVECMTLPPSFYDNSNYSDSGIIAHLNNKELEDAKSSRLIEESSRYFTERSWPNYSDNRIKAYFNNNEPEDPKLSRHIEESYRNFTEHLDTIMHS